jgi:hypothetical protein
MKEMEVVTVAVEEMVLVSLKLGKGRSSHYPTRRMGIMAFKNG